MLEKNMEKEELSYTFDKYVNWHKVRTHFDNISYSWRCVYPTIQNFQSKETCPKTFIAALFAKMNDWKKPI